MFANPTTAIHPLGLKCCVRSVFARLTPTSSAAWGKRRVKAAARRAQVCAKICDNSADCEMSQRLELRSFDPGYGWSEQASNETPSTDTAPLLRVERPSKNEVCMTDDDVDMILTKARARPEWKWSHTFVCNGIDDCGIKGRSGEPSHTHSNALRRAARVSNA